MAKKVKEELSWMPLQVETLPKSLQAKHDAIREAFKGLNVLKEAFQTECDGVLAKIVTSWPAKSAAEKAAVAAAEAVPGTEVPSSPFTIAMNDLRVGQDGKFLPGTVRKFSYMRGIAVAGAKAPGTSSNNKGLALS